LQQGGASVILTLSQDGYSNGVLTQSTIDKASGQIIGHFSNGQIRILAQLSPTVFDIPEDKKDKRKRRHNRTRQKNHDRRNNTDSDMIQAQQSGVWTVGQLGTWHVKIDSDHNQPMAVMDMMKAKRSPWSAMRGFTFDEGRNSTNQGPLTIPENQRLVIEHVSLFSNVKGRQQHWDEQKISGYIQVTLNDKP
ncbi:MAG: hypothetical protein ACPGYT_16335, partial [Nitrospirales bacterium]